MVASCKPLAAPGDGAEADARGQASDAAAAAVPPTPPPTPAPTPPLVWFTLDRVSVTTPDGVVGYPPGTMVRYIAEGLFFLDGHEIELSPLQVTPDLDVVSEVLAGREAQRQMLERQKFEALRQRGESRNGENAAPPAQMPANGGGASLHNTPQPATAATGAGWFSGGRSPASQPAMPVLPAEPVVRQPAAPAAAEPAPAATGPVSLPLRAQPTTPPMEGRDATLQAARPHGRASVEPADAAAADGENLKTAVRQYQTGNTRYTIRVKGEQVEE